MVEPGAIGRAVLEEVAAREGVPPTELDGVLYDAIDPDALEALVEHAARTDAGTRLVVTFTFQGYDVRVDETGEITVHGPEPSPEEFRNG